MTFPKKQNALDWTTQCWNIAFGERVDPPSDAIGRPGESAAEFIQRLADERGQTVRRDIRPAGLARHPETWGADISPEVCRFYRQTSDYRFEVRSLWEGGFGFLGHLLSRLFSRRVQQLNLPVAKNSDVIRFRSELVQMVDEGGEATATIWLRSQDATGEMVFYGIYSECRLPSGRAGVKSVFPLPQGNATVIFGIDVGEDGSLHLVSVPETHEGTGFTFFVEDSKGGLWRHFLRKLKQILSVYDAGGGHLRATHTIWLGSLPVHRMEYAIRRMEKGGA